MPTITINDCQYYYEIQGRGEETIMLSHGLLWSGKMFHKQVEHFKVNYRVITYDHRGQGRTEVTKNGYDMDQLYEDTVMLIERLNVGPVHFGGLSMGGFVAMRLAARRPDLVKSLILMETSAQPEPFTFKYNLLKTMVKFFGVKSVEKPVMKIMFGETFLNDPDRDDEMSEWATALTNNKKSITKAVTGVIERKGVESELGNISCPTLILVGNEDKATVPAKAEFIHQNIMGATLVYIENAGHTACIEEPEQYNAAIANFLEGVTRP
ncbi:alpha/beta fold hydrolase [Sungkyunkwania multivorans]|uniref:Alpha/beta fold hydrolase n=1 Tax=Sungkyunkwania multivorans TaxID=1173618 RepID=A0ABW3CZJ4_9FLAO